jgi:hypothetical protein
LALVKDSDFPWSEAELDSPAHLTSELDVVDEVREGAIRRIVSFDFIQRCRERAFERRRPEH